LKNTTCIDVKGVDEKAVVAETNSAGREALTGIDFLKIEFASYITDENGIELVYFGNDNGTFYYNCFSNNEFKLIFSLAKEGTFIHGKGGSIEWVVDGLEFKNHNQENFISALGYRGTITATARIYDNINGTKTYLGSLSQTITIDKGACPIPPVVVTPPPTDYITATASETTICAGNLTTITTTGTCPSANITWKKGDVTFGSSGGSLTTTEAGVYKAVCSSPNMISNTVTIAMGTTTCPQPPAPIIEPPLNFITASANETSLCPGSTATLTATSNCPTSNITWRKNDVVFGAAAVSSLTTTESGTYKAVCSNPAMTSNAVSVTFSSSPSVPIISTNRHSITPGESAVLSATNCQGTVVWYGNNFTDVGDETIVNQAGNYKALCRSNCNGTNYYSDLTPAGIDIALMPLRIEANKLEVYPNESVTLTAYGCTNGFVQWKINGTLQKSSDNPITFNSSAVYSANCTNWNATVNSGWVSLYIAAKAANVPTITANKTQAYNNDDVILTATGCGGSSYSWYVPARQLNGTIVNEWRSGPQQTVKGSGTYKAWCYYNGVDGPPTYITINEIRPGDISISANKTVAAPGEPVTLNVAGSCPDNAGIHWRVAGQSYWTNRFEPLTVSGFGTYQAQCFINDYSHGGWANITINPPLPGGVTIISNKTQAAPNELITLQALGCNGEVVWTLPPPDLTEVRGSATLFAYGPGLYKAKCVRFGQNGTPATITILAKPLNSPSFTPSQPIAAINQWFSLTALNCPNNDVQWGVPKKDANGNIYYDYSYFFANMIVRGPGTYKGRCLQGSNTSYQDIIVFPTATAGDALIIVANKTKALPTESVTLTAYGCPNGTVKWEIGSQTATGFQITRHGPGDYKARCIGDPSNNGDYAIASVVANGGIVPIITTSADNACPNQPVTLTASGCPANWHYQWQIVKDSKLDYWYNNRNSIENGGNGYYDVFDILWGNQITRNGSRIYYARCVKDDYSWMGNFQDKSYTIDPAFPTDLRASNNGPALMGTPSVKLAVTEVAGVSYAWTGPYTFTNANIRNPEITTPTEANSGIYKVTLKRGTTESWACTTTATTKVAISGCDIRIKASDPSTGLTLTTLQKDPLNEGQYLPIALMAENGDGTPIQNMTYTWTAPSGVTLTTPNAAFILVQKSGNYSLRVAALTNSNIGCRTTIQIAQENSQEILWAKRYSTTFANGTPVKVVPIQYNGGRRRFISNATNAQITIDVQKYIGHSMMLLYTKNSLNRKDIMHVIPTDAYNNSHTTINSADFSGWVKIYDYTGTIFRGGWKYENGLVLGRIAEYNTNGGPPTDDCVIKTIHLDEVDNTAASTQVASRPVPKSYNSITDVANANISKGTHVIIGGKEFVYTGTSSLPCCSSCTPPGTTQGEDPPSTNGESPANTETLKGGAASQPTTPFGEIICVQVAQLLACAEKNTPQAIINRNPNDTPDIQATKFEESKKRFVLYVKLIEQALKDHPVLKPYASQINFPTSQTTLDVLAGSYGNAINDQTSYESVSCSLTSGFGSATVPKADLDRLADDLGKVCNQINEAYKALVPLIEDCNNANGLVNDILNTLETQGKKPVNVFKYGKYSEETDITALWNGLKGSQTPVSTNNPENPSEVMLLRSDGVKMRFSPTNGNIYSYLRFTKDECEDKISNDLCKLLNALDLTKYSDLQKFLSVAISRSQGITDPTLQQQIITLREQIHQAQLAKLSRYVYEDKNDPVNLSTDWQKAIQPASVLQQINNANSNIEGFNAALFDDNTVTPTKKVLVFRGTDDFMDAITDLVNGVGFLTPQYQAAVNIALNLKLSYPEIEFAGHSLGGGLASAAAAVTGKEATIFNPASIDYGVISSLTISPPISPSIFEANKANVKAIINDKDPLNGLQDNRNNILPVIAALGVFYPPLLVLAPVIVATVTNGGLQKAYTNTRIPINDGAKDPEQGHSIARMGDTLQKNVKIAAEIIKNKIKPNNCKE
jgi:hypothetical protein